jgi:hypothetical protein
LFGLLLDASEDAMDQNHPAVCFMSAFLIGQQAAQRKPLTLGGPDHGGNLDEETFATQTALEIRRPCLRFRQEVDSGADSNELHGQFKFGKSGLADATVIVRHASHEAGKPQMTRLIGAVLSEGRPPIL